jgi:hypothetical protein
VGKKVTEQKMCVLIFSIFSEIFLIMRRNERDMIKNVYWLHVKILMKCKCSKFIFSKNTQISNFVKIRPFWRQVVPCEWKGGQT